MRSWQPKQLQCISRTRLLGSSEIRQKKLEVGLVPVSIDNVMAS
jgi:hypothetical protein